MIRAACSLVQRVVPHWIWNFSYGATRKWVETEDRHSARLPIENVSTNSDAKYSEKDNLTAENSGTDERSWTSRRLLFQQARCVLKAPRAALTRSGAESRLESEAY